ncbi:TonB-dependent receptor [Sphingomonas sp. SUN019]|uniref:TonB-dependent receptor n=1 Tax=Sphingomonas sp. SUN019 TaxID=2937788 RepID=UPI0021648FBE|nr:TonB-dependent receptor [Sphingomonas sp. SUN019]UVO49715.1 TonB-dependent receptor [Sphingomonas sp. SUN019]
MAALTAAPAFAQEAPGTTAAAGSASEQTAGPPTTAGGLEDIIVTARKRVENLQDVSTSVSALSANELSQRFDSDVRDFANAAPNVLIDDTQQGPGGVASAAIRGIGVADVEKAIDPTVGIVLDDIYFGTSSGGLIKAIDIDRVEVLRGPQGTLFGRNAIAGVINLTRSRPTQELTGKVRATYANYDSLDLEGVVSFGLTDWAAVKFSGARKKTDGYIYNTLQNQDGQRSDFTALGVQLLLTPTPGLELSFSFDDQNTDQDPPQLSNVSGPTSLLGAPPIARSNLFCAVLNQCSPAFGVPQQGDRYQSISNGPLNKNAFFDTNLFIAKVKYDLTADLELQYIYGRYETDEAITQDFDATPLTLFHTDRPARYHQDTHELRLTKGGGGPLSFVAGLYYWDSAYRIDLVSYIGFVVPDTVLALPQTVRQTNKSYAGFFDVDYRFTDWFKLTLGGRYTKDKKTQGVRDLGFDFYDDPVKDSWKKFTPKVALSFEPTDDVLAYGLWSRGYRTGGFTGRPATENAARTPYQPETVDNYEIGVKAELLDRRLRVNGAIFKLDYKDKQEEFSVPAPVGTGQETRILNAATATVKGVELDVTALLFDGFTLNGNVGYLDAKYKNFVADVDSDGIVTDNSGLKFRRAPKWNWTLSANYEREIGPGTAYLQGTWHYLGAHEMTFLNNPALRNPGQDLVDASISYKVGKTMLSGFVRNLLKEDGWSIGFDVQGLWSYAAPRTPRTYGIALTQTF